MINNKKVFLIYIICFFLFLTLLIFPNYSNKTILIIFSIKEKLEIPFKKISLEAKEFKYQFTNNQILIKKINELNKENEYLKNINNYFKILTSKYSDQYKVFHESSLIIPQSVGVSVIGDRNLIYNKNFIINKGSKSGIKISDYVIDGIEIVGRVKSVALHTSEVVTVKSIQYGDEVLIEGNSFIVSGTNNDYLSFLRQKDNSQEYDFSYGQIAEVQKNYVNLILGKIDFFDKQPILKTKKKFNLDNLRVIIND